MKPFMVPGKTFNGQSRSSVMSSIIRSPRLSTTDPKSRLHLFSEKNSLNDLEGRSRSLAMAQLIGYISNPTSRL